MKTPRSAWIILLVLSFLSTVTVILFVGWSVKRLQLLTGWQENGFEFWLLCGVVFLGWMFRQRIWQLGLVCAACNLMAYLAYRQHHPDLQRIFTKLGDLVMLIYVFNGNGGWRRKLGRKLKNAAMTAINAASFKRQIREVA